MTHFSPVFAATAGTDVEGFAAAFLAEDEHSSALGAGIPKTVRPAAPAAALTGFSLMLHHLPSDTFFVPCQLWTYTAQPGVTDIVYGPLLECLTLPGAGPVVPWPAAVPGVSTLQGLSVPSWAPPGVSFRTLGLPTVTNPPSVGLLPGGFFVATQNTVTSGTAGLPAPFDVLDLALPAALTPIAGLAAAAVPDWIGEMP
ncbi:MAG: hypothetical protein KGQ66_13110 [Acidobacteriota bacterium]|nr:hypothetical protein [Acidobacteriota bacterium]